MANLNSEVYSQPQDNEENVPAGEGDSNKLKHQKTENIEHERNLNQSPSLIVIEKPLNNLHDREEEKLDPNAFMKFIERFGCDYIELERSDDFTKMMTDFVEDPLSDEYWKYLFQANKLQNTTKSKAPKLFERKPEGRQNVEKSEEENQ